VVAGGPWRRPVVELKIASLTLNGTNDYWRTIDPDATDVEMSKVGLWTYYARVELSGIAIYETTYP
jgi:hypothetical protein